MSTDANRMRVFTEVVRRGSFSAAAFALHITPSAVSHAIGKLENELGQELLRFVGRKLQLTDAATHLFAASDRAFSQLEEAQEQVRAGAVMEHFTLGCTVEFGTMVLVRKLAPWTFSANRLRLHFHFSNDLGSSLVSGEVDMAVDCRGHLDPGLEVIELFLENYVVVANEVFLHLHPLTEPADLGPIPVLSMDFGALWWERFQNALERDSRPVFRHVVVLNHLRGLIAAACEGMGVALVPRYAVARELSSGVLVQLFPEIEIPPDRFSIYQKTSWAKRDKNRRVVNALRHLSMEEFADSIAPVMETREKITEDPRQER